MTTENNKEKSWIVLMNRVPRGPYTAVEITELMTKNLIRATDLAYIAVEDPKAVHEWKFLWQFTEFDRRKKTDDGAVPSGGATRQKLTPDQIRGKVLSQLPGELASASRDEIVRQSKRQLATAPFEIPAAASPSRGTDWWKIALPALVIALAFFFFGGRRAKHVESEVPERVPVVDQSPVPSPAALVVNPSPAPARAPVREISRSAAPRFSPKSPDAVATEEEPRPDPRDKIRDSEEVAPDEDSNDP